LFSPSIDSSSAFEKSLLSEPLESDFLFEFMTKRSSNGVSLTVKLPNINP